MYGESLADIILIGEATVPGQFKWEDEEFCPEYSDDGSKFRVTFTPDDNGYATITTDAELTVVQKDPEIPEEEILEL